MIQTKVRASHFWSGQVDFATTRLDGQVIINSWGIHCFWYRNLFAKWQMSSGPSGPMLWSVFVSEPENIQIKSCFPSLLAVLCGHRRGVHYWGDSRNPRIRSDGSHPRHSNTLPQHCYDTLSRQPWPSCCNRLHPEQGMKQSFRFRFLDNTIFFTIFPKKSHFGKAITSSVSLFGKCKK